MTPTPLPKHVFATILTLTQSDWAYQHWWDGNTRNIQALRGEQELTIIYTGTQVHANHNGERISRHHITKTIKEATK